MVQLRTCPISLSVAGMKTLTKKQHKVERVYLISQLQVVCPVLQGSLSSRSQLRQLVTADRNEAMRVHLLACAQLHFPTLTQFRTPS